MPRPPSSDSITITEDVGLGEPGGYASRVDGMKEWNCLLREQWVQRQVHKNALTAENRTAGAGRLGQTDWEELCSSLDFAL